MASDPRSHWENDPSSSEELEGEDIEGVEYAPRSVGGSQSGRSLEEFLQDEDSASIQGPSFYRAFSNGKSLSLTQLPEGVSTLLSKKEFAPGYVPTSPFAWTSGSAFGKRICITPPSNFQAPSSRCILQNVGGKRLASEASAGNCSPSPTSRRRGLAKKRRRVILSQDSEDEQPVAPLPLVEVAIGQPVDRVRATDRSQEHGFAQEQAQIPGRVMVHTERDGTIQTVQENKLGTAFFSKLSRAKLHYQDPKNGPQGFSKRYAALCEHKVELQLLDHKGYRSYGSYSDWPTARDFTSQQPFLEEVLVEGKPCKPFLDMERDQGLPEGETLESIISQFQEAITKIFAEDYAVEIQERDFNWVHCDYGPGGKFSVHLVISTHGPRQMVFRSNLAPNVDPQGAGHLARRLAKVLPPTLADLIDQSVYTRNRGIRMPGCAKPSRPDCPLRPLDHAKPYADSVITWQGG
ncbi:hypothetical protein KFL_003860070 [Klebsormidium nitens]|uniref:Uncharacterized protein n=1 Tax=Klebsormidium nitens TaxID=105231 RepID=A0A1Y1IFM7_KLENI|nr:hypothetical protein KFL_003860070 [Klebsormidium nitens]|eukprot:GAQ87901.1 hypothetical protein KFL_003860070 [Klebsormidium nitens]